MDYSELVKRLREHNGWALNETLDAAADAIEELSHDYEKLAEDFNGAVELLHKRKKPRWIPVTERLPEEDTEVLISYRYKEGEGDTDHVNIDITSYGTTCFGGREIHTLKEWRQPFDYFHANYEVIAWMPLPEPPKEETE